MLSFLQTALAFILIISVIVFIHELGHFLVARLFRVRITTFSIGFGKELWGFNDKHGTRWRFSALPLGGYVKMFGDASAASTEDSEALAAMTPQERIESFHFKPLWQKALIVAAGPAFNFILTIALFTGLIFTNGLTSTQPIVGAVVEDSAAEEAGLLEGDRIVMIDDREIGSFNDIPRMIAINLGTPVELTVERDGRRFAMQLTPRIVTEEDPLAGEIKRPLIGIRSQELTFTEVGLGGAVVEAVHRTYEICVMSLQGVGQMITGQRSPEELKGPIGIAELSGKAAGQGVQTIIWFMALISANLGLVNLLPIPLLDGGHLLYYGVEALRGRPMADAMQQWGFRLGFAVIGMLMVFTIFNDLRGLIS